MRKGAARRCVGCNVPLDRAHRDLGVCQGCLQPERIEASLMDLPDPLRRVMLRVGRDFGVVPRE
jgi:hypothetical protein